MAGVDVRLPASVTVTVSCRTARNSTKGSRRHPVTIHPDGTIDTGHDLEQERILAALGGYLSCLELVETAAPAFLTWFAFQQRLIPRPIQAPHERGRWRAVETAGCCPRRGFDTALDAASHVRDPKHAALLHGAHARQVAELTRGVEGLAVPEMPDGPWFKLWECGMHPDQVERISLELDLDDTLPAEFYLAVMARQPDLAWLRSTMQALPLSPRTIVSLAWTYGALDREQLDLRARWLATGVMDRLVVPLMHSPYEIADVEAFGAYWRLSLTAAAMALLEWARSGVSPQVDQLVGTRFDHLGVPPRPPTDEARRRLRDVLGTEMFTEEQLAIALSVFGSVGMAARGLEWGITI